MGKRHYVWDKQAEKWVDVATLPPRPRPNAPMIMRDIDPYQSVITREWITSRSHHREHLRQHDCIEFGNDLPAAPTPSVEMPPVAPDIVRAMEQLECQ